MKSTLNNIAVVVGIVDGTTHIEVKVSLNKEESTYTVWTTVGEIKHTHTFMHPPIANLASAMEVFTKELKNREYILSVLERSIIEMRLRNEADDNMEVVCFGEAHPKMITYENNEYASAVTLGWNFGVSYTEEDQIEYLELDSFELEGGRVMRLFQLRHPCCLHARLLIRNCSKESEPTAADSILAMGNTFQIFMVAYKDQSVAWKKYMTIKMAYMLHKQQELTCGALSIDVSKDNKEKEPIALEQNLTSGKFKNDLGYPLDKYEVLFEWYNTIKKKIEEPHLLSGNVEILLRVKDTNGVAMLQEFKITATPLNALKNM